MSSPEPTEMDPALAAMMGFSSFGGAPKPAPSKKRRLNDHTTSVAAPHPSSGANEVQLGVRSTQKLPERPPATSTVENNSASGGAAPQGVEQQRVEDWRKGVKNARGDVAYFLPSFLEDPWQDLK